MFSIRTDDVGDESGRFDTQLVVHLSSTGIGPRANDEGLVSSVMMKCFNTAT